MINIKGALFQWCINVLIKKTSGGAIKNKIMQNKEMAAELTHKKHKTCTYVDNIWGAELANM